MVTTPSSSSFDVTITMADDGYVKEWEGKDLKEKLEMVPIGKEEEEDISQFYQQGAEQSTRGYRIMAKKSEFFDLPSTIHPSGTHFPGGNCHIIYI